MIALNDVVERFRAGKVAGAGGPLVADQAISTHRSVVLLTGQWALKLRRPIALAPGDQSTAHLRLGLARNEVMVGRLLSPEIYLGLATLTEGEDGALSLVTDPAAAGETVLVMRRLDPRDRGDLRLGAGDLGIDALRPLMARLCDFHQDATTFAISQSASALGHFNDRARAACDRAADGGVIAPLQAQSLYASLAEHAASLETLLEHRVREQRIRQLHGAVRLDHLYLGQPSGIIDPAERGVSEAIGDTAEDVALLWLQLHGAGAGDLADEAVNLYAGAASDGTLTRVLPLFARLAALLEAEKVEAEKENAQSTLTPLGRWYVDRARSRR